MKFFFFLFRKFKSLRDCNSAFFSFFYLFFNFVFIYSFSTEAPMTFLQFSCFYWFAIYFTRHINAFLQILWVILWRFLNIYFDFFADFHAQDLAHYYVISTFNACFIVFSMFIFIYFLIIMSYYTHLYKSGRIASKEEFWVFVLVWMYFMSVFWYLF